MVRNTLLLVLGFVLVATLAVAGCQPAAPPTLSEPVPQGTNLIALVSINDILTDPDLVQAYDEADKDPDMPQTVDEMLAEIEYAIGIDPRDFSEVLVFADTKSDEGYWGAIITGSYDEAALLEGIELAIGQEMTPVDYLGYQVYIDEYNENALCFLAQNQFLVGAVAAVQDSLNVVLGYAPALAGRIVESYTAMGDSWMKVATGTPAEWTEEAQEDDDSLSVRMLRSVETVGAGLRKAGQNVTVEVRLGFKSPLIAGFFMWNVWLAKTVIPLATDIPPGVENTLAKIDLGISGSYGTLSLTSTVDEVQELIDTMQEGDW